MQPTQKAARLKRNVDPIEDLIGIRNPKNIESCDFGYKPAIYNLLICFSFHPLIRFY